jgi:hypothetical protein
MKVLHLPLNVASQISITVCALREIGIEARGLARQSSVIQDYRGIETMPWMGKPNPVARLWRSVRWRFRLVRAMQWADVIHWHWGESTWRGLDLKVAAALKKPRLVEFWGSDVREHRRASQDNPFLARLYQQYPELLETESERAQGLFHRHGFACLIPGCELSDYLDPSFFPGYYQTCARLPVHEYIPKYPDPENRKPLLVHAPSQKQRKGTEAVLRAVDELAGTNSFEFRLIHNVPREEALKLVASCDVFLDQFTIGAEGLAAHEAMALGKPVLCYIKPALLPRYPPELPIIVADQYDLREKLAAIVNDGGKRYELGRRSRAYMETHHEARKLAADLVKIYRELLNRVSPGSAGGNWKTTIASTNSASGPLA